MIRVYEDHHDPDLADIVSKLKAKGVRYCVVPCKVVPRRAFPPPREIAEYRPSGQLWCPYCGAWRWFRVPQYKAKQEIPTISNLDPFRNARQLQWFLNSSNRMSLKHCSWCLISEEDWWVKYVNSTWEQRVRRRRTRRRRIRR